MIQIICANCKTTLEVDDAFAGGVCRCQHCGTIQTVPRPNARAASPGSISGSSGGGSRSAGEGKALYQVHGRSDVSSTPSGLDELADIVHSSGLSGSGLAHRTGRGGRQVPQYATPAAGLQNRKSRLPLIIGASVVSLLLLAVLFFGLRKTAVNTIVPAPGINPPAKLSPNFAGLDLAGQRIIYVLDRGDATRAYFEDLKKATAASIRSIGPERKFQIILWNNGNDDAYPLNSTAFGTTEEAARARQWFDDVSTGRSTDIQPALKAALKQTPDEIVIATGKSDQLFADFTGDVLALLKGKNIKVNTVTLGDSPASDPLRKIALETGGKFIAIKRGELQALVEQLP